MEIWDGSVSEREGDQAGGLLDSARRGTSRGGRALVLPESAVLSVVFWPLAPLARRGELALVTALRGAE